MPPDFSLPISQNPPSKIQNPPLLLGVDVGGTTTDAVRELALAWRDRGALLFGLSDKPDEASIPPDDLRAAGYLPIHRTPTHAVEV